MDTIGYVCGIGGGNWPQPGDPSNNGILRATPAFGGVDINITFPTINPHAVAHTKLYRAYSSNFGMAQLIARMDGSFFHDKTTDSVAREQFYWIEIVSVNGTVGDLIGPASAIAKPLIEDMITMLSGKIDDSLLGQALRTKIGKITGLEDGLQQESQYRREDDATTARAFTSLQATFQDTVSVVAEETIARSTADSALAQHILTVQAQLGDDVATVEQTMGAYIVTNDGVIDGLGGSLSDLETELIGTNDRMGAIYTVKLQAGDLVGGFGLVNNSKTITAGFDVDNFWIGRAGTKRKPFIIENNTVYIDDAVINKLVFSKLRNESGSFVVENDKIKMDHVDIASARIKWAQVDSIAVQKGHIVDGAISSAKIGHGEILTLNVGEAQIDRLNLKDGAVTFSQSFNFARFDGATGSNVWTTTRWAWFNVAVPAKAVFIFNLWAWQKVNDFVRTRLLLNGVEVPAYNYGIVREEAYPIYLGGDAGDSVGYRSVVDQNAIYVTPNLNLRAGGNELIIQKLQSRSGHGGTSYAAHEEINVQVLAWYK